MYNSKNKSSNLYALLIGIDCYLPNKLPDGGYYASLGGCTGDIGLVEDLLQRKLGVPKEQILKLSSSLGEKGTPIEPQNQWPTYKNMVCAFKKTSAIAQRGDQVLIYYSGHGGRTTTIYEKIKGSNGIDEALVPMDIGYSESNYLRDVQLAYLLKMMVDKGLLVTIVLDSCHSGGATRGNAGAIRRGVSNSSTGIDFTKRSVDESVASVNELSEMWRGLAANRNVKMGSGWLLEPKGYVLLAACRASESAFEFPFNGEESHGALTYWLIDSLKKLGPALSYKMLYDQILAKVHIQFPEQTPQLQGENDRMVFGSERVQPVYAVLVMRVDISLNRIQLNAGQANGLRKGAKFAIYPSNVQDFSKLNERLALAEITELGAVESLANITNKLHQGTIEQGAQAVFLEAGNLRLQRSVTVLARAKQIKQKIENAIVNEGESFVRLARVSEPADFQVAINATTKEYEIWDSAGNILPNICPSIGLSEADGEVRIAKRLVHLSKYRNVLELDNNDALSPLANKLQVELTGVQSDYDPVDKPDPQPFDSQGGVPTIKHEQWVFLRIKNNLKPAFEGDPEAILNVTVLDLQPDWGIRQVFPSGAGFFEPLDPSRYINIPLRGYLPEGYETGIDNIKVFATKGTTSFRWLELPSLDQPIASMRSANTRAPTDPLEQLLYAVALNQGGLRHADPAAYPSRDWVTAQVQLRIQKTKE
jgi:hypothetical protein